MRIALILLSVLAVSALAAGAAGCGGASCSAGLARFYYNRATDNFVSLQYETFPGYRTNLIFDDQGRGWLFGTGLFKLVDEQFEFVDEFIVSDYVIRSDGNTQTIQSVAKGADGTIWVLAQIDRELGLWVLGNGDR